MHSISCDKKGKRFAVWVYENALYGGNLALPYIEQ